MASALDDFARWRRDHGPQYSTSSRCTPKGHSENTAITLTDLEVYLKQRHPIQVAGSFTHHERFCTLSTEPTSQPKPKPKSADDKPVFRQVLLKNPDGDGGADYTMWLDYKKSLMRLGDSVDNEDDKKWLLWRLSEGQPLAVESYGICKFYIDEILTRSSE